MGSEEGGASLPVEVEMVAGKLEARRKRRVGVGCVEFKLGEIGLNW